VDLLRLKTLTGTKTTPKRYDKGRFPGETSCGLIRGNHQNWTKEGLEESLKPFYGYSISNFSSNRQKNVKTMSVEKKANHQMAYYCLDITLNIKGNLYFNLKTH